MPTKHLTEKNNEIFRNHTTKKRKPGQIHIFWKAFSPRPGGHTRYGGYPPKRVKRQIFVAYRKKINDTEFFWFEFFKEENSP
jgi:hypothetical protein